MISTTISEKPFSWTKALFISLGVGLLAVSSSIFLQTHGASLGSLRNELAQAAGANAAGVGVPVKPARLIIPAIGVDAQVQSVGLAWQGNGDMGVPTNFTDVGWYNGGPLPGEPGSAVIDGHLDGRNVREAVFYNLDKLKIGDLVEVVDTNGQTLRFRVVGTKVYDYDAPTADIFSGDTSKARLNLITCAGSWDASAKLYNKRIVVFTELVSNT